MPFLSVCNDSHLQSEMIDDDAGGDTDVHRVLGAKLWYFQTAVTGIDDFLVNAFHLVAQHHGVALMAVGTEGGQHGGAFSLFHAEHRHSAGFQLLHGLQSAFSVAPSDAVLSSKSRFVNLGVGWCACNAS